MKQRKAINHKAHHPPQPSRQVPAILGHLTSPKLGRAETRWLLPDLFPSLSAELPLALKLGGLAWWPLQQQALQPGYQHSNRQRAGPGQGHWAHRDMKCCCSCSHRTLVSPGHGFRSWAWVGFFPPKQSNLMSAPPWLLGATGTAVPQWPSKRPLGMPSTPSQSPQRACVAAPQGGMLGTHTFKSQDSRCSGP